MMITPRTTLNHAHHIKYICVSIEILRNMRCVWFVFVLHEFSVIYTQNVM